LPTLRFSDDLFFIGDMMNTPQNPMQPDRSFLVDKFLVKFLQFFGQTPKNKGLTIPEFLVILLILGILAAIALPSLLSQSNKSKQVEARNNIGAMNRAQQGIALGGGTITSTTPTTPYINPNITAFDSQSNTEQYDFITDNTFQPVNKNPLSTFSIDVDTASYSNMRRFISSGQLPPPDAVRIEELINYFTYDYPQPSGNDPFSITTEVSQAPWNPQHQLVHIGLQGKHVSSEEMPPSNLVFLIDVSGSMSSPNKLGLVKSSLQMLVDRLTEQDRVSIVVYAGAAGLVLPPTPGNEKQKILRAINRLKAGGSTAGGQGIKLAYEVAKNTYIPDGNNRVILASDGDFNVGISSDADLVRLIEEYRDRGVFLTVLGFGMGNLKDSKMEQLADKGNGNYAYIDNKQEAQKVLVTEMSGTLLTIAKDVKIQVEFNPAEVQAYRLIGYENRMLKTEDFNNDKKDAGELGSGHSVTALYEIIPTGVASDIPLPDIDPLRYQTNSDEMGDPATYKDNELMLVKLRYKSPKEDTSQLITQPVIDRSLALDNTSTNFKFSAAVAEFGMILRDSEYKGNANFAQVLNLAQQSRDVDLEGYRQEFISLVENTEQIYNTLKSYQKPEPTSDTSGTFANSISEMGIGIQDSVNHTYFTEAIGDTSFNYAIAKNNSSKSYVGGVFLLDNTSVSILCEAKNPGTIKLDRPTLENGTLTCPPGTITLGQ
jgi:Ca-activated chloride channel family protein